MFILNEHRSYLTINFKELCISYKIILFLLFSHSTHLIQSLNVDYFQSVKYYYTETVDEAIKDDNITFSKLNFLTVFSDIRKKIFISQIIKSAFKKTEFISTDVQSVLNKMTAKMKALIIQKFRIKTSTSESESALLSLS